MIGTPSNRELLRGAGLLAHEGEQAGPNDLVIAVRAAANAGTRRTRIRLELLSEKETQTSEACQRAHACRRARAAAAAPTSR